ncbi:hypothetical protein AB5J52_48075 (plasmid) [Streptomyces sp. R39]|uniref:Uncharacterized protein n=1 Tax=Streptomyces sp. R39 TaxID=3238631 RepID=A0AB39R4K6_9ACTN
MTTPAAIAHRAAKILGSAWNAYTGSWEALGRLNAPDTDTYTLDVDVDEGELRLTAGLDPTGPIATFREMHTPAGIAAVTEAVAQEIRRHLAETAPDPTASDGPSQARTEAPPPPGRPHSHHLP